MAVSKPLLTEFGIHHRLESCEIILHLHSFYLFLDAALYNQLAEYIEEYNQNKSRTSRSASDEQEEMAKMVQRFLRDKYPGAKAFPNQLVKLMASQDPARALERNSILEPPNESCDSGGTASQTSNSGYKEVPYCLESLNGKLNEPSKKCYFWADNGVNYLRYTGRNLATEFTGVVG